ncbi:protein piccolo-like [Schistocerca americana]|uniref:protein piccolo-like n=1 Tax=Schistocerca americana TaxID=7009 RepID=UPI001F4FA637|nr:protein piccolo-like [Schistocerca americana]
MDLLVQLCTSHRLSPGGHSLQPLGEKGALPYKPSTPIGLLEAWSVRVLPKGAGAAAAAGAAPALQEHPHQLPFQHTFRLQVHLPRNQLLVSRVTPQMGLAAVLKMACDEKNLDSSKYELRHPINLEERLRPELTLGDYGLTEVCVMARDASGADALALQKEQERRRRRAKQQRGHAAPPPPTVRQTGTEVSAITGSVSSGSLGGRSSSPDSAPAAPPPRAPARKRRPAPPPPAVTTDSADKRDSAVVISKASSKQVVSHHDGTAPTVTHSRTSSDSSGYHEASVLSDGPDTHPGDKTIAAREMPPPTSNSTLPRRSKLPPATGTSAALPKRTGPTVGNSVPLSRSVSNLATGVPGRMVHGEHSTSTSSLSSTGRGPRKKKAAPPPPPVAVTPAGPRAVSPDRSAATPAPSPAEPPAVDATAESRTLPRPTAPTENSDARRSARIEEEKEAPSPERRTSSETGVKHHQQQQRSSTELTAEKADLYAKLQRRLPSRGDSVTSTSSSGSEDAAAATAGRGPAVEERERAPVPAPAVRPSRSRDGASAAARDRRTDGQSRPQPDVVAVQVQPLASPPAPKGKDTAPPVPLPRKKLPGKVDGADAPPLADPADDVDGDGAVPPPLSRTGSGSSLGIYGSVGRTFGAGSSLLAMSSETSSVGTGCADDGADADDGLLGVEESLFDREAAVPEEEFVDLEDGEERVGGRLGRWPNSENLHALLGRGSVSSKHSSTAPDEDDTAVDEGIGNDDAAEEVARAFASAAAELEAAILAEDLAAATAEAEENPAADYSTFDPPCPKSLRAANLPPQLPPSPDPPAVVADAEDWHYEIPAPPSAFRDLAETPPPTPWSYEEGEVRSKANPLYDSREFVADSSVAKEKSDSSGEPTAATELRNSGQTTDGSNAQEPEEEVADRQRALTGAERQLQGVLDAKARLLLPQPQPQLIQGPAADADAVLKDTDDGPAEDGTSDVPDVGEDSSVSQENHSHSLLNHHHAGHLHRHTADEHHHDHRHHLHHDDHHHHDPHSANVGMPAYLTETIDTLEGFEDLIAVGSGSRPPEERQNVEGGSNGAAELEVVRRNSSGVERPVVVAEVVKSSEGGVTPETSPVGAEAAKVARRSSASSYGTSTESEKGSESSSDLSVESGEVPSRRRPSGELGVGDGKASKDEGTRAESDRQQRAQRRRTVEVAGPLVNFTITTYQREIDPDKIFAEAEDAAESRVSAATAPSSVAGAGGERRPSQVSRSNSVGGSGSACSSSAGSSRRGSHAEQQRGGSHAPGVKRSVSNVYAALQDVAAREEARARGAAESTNEEDSGSSQLQSVQVLRSILPQLKTTPEREPSSSSSEGSGATADASAAVPRSERPPEDSWKTAGEARVTEVGTKPQPQPYRPPAISFASWGERPRDRAVSLKVDSDYRVGGAHTQAQQTSREPQTQSADATADIAKAPTLDGAVPEKKPEPVMAVPSGQNVHVRSGDPAPALAPPAAAKVEPTVIRISTAEPRIRAVQLKSQPAPSGVQRSDPAAARRDGAALTMRIISHTTAAPFVRQGTTSVTVNGDERVVPVVRAVELKKSALQQVDRNGQVGSGEEEERFVGVSSLAKRFSVLGDNTVVQRRNSGVSRVARRPVSELVTASDAALASASVSADPVGPVHRTGSFASLVSASRASQLGRSDSSDDTRIGSSAGLVSQNGLVSPTAKQAPVTVSAAPKGFPLPVVKGFRVPGAGAPEPRKGITLVAKPKVGAGAAPSASAPAPAQNPHEQLMAAIRGFGGTGNLGKQTQNVAECES